MDNSTCLLGAGTSSRPSHQHGTLAGWRDGCRGNHCVAAYEEWYASKHSAAHPDGRRNKPGSDAARAYRSGGYDSLAAYLISEADEPSGLLGCMMLRKPGRHGYPEVSVAGKRMKAYRVVARSFLGDIGILQVHHKCAQRGCINPEHLQLVSGEQNKAEMMLRNGYIKMIKKLAARLDEVAPGDELVGDASQFLSAQDWRSRQ